MAKPLKFHQTLNQAPRSVKHGQHRRARQTPHRYSAVGADHSAGGSDQGRATSATYSPLTWDIPYSEPTPPAIPHAGVRAGEIIAHRLWWVIDGQLCSLAHRRLWEPGERVYGDTLKPVQHWWGSSFGRPIWGGTYGFLHADQLKPEITELLEAFERMRGIDGSVFMAASFLTFGFQPLLETQTAVSGTIKIWGDVVEHERGYRAEFAKLHSIDAIFGPGDIDELRAKYGVDALNIHNPESK